MYQHRLQNHFHSKHVLVTGGTGSFGNQIVQELIPYDPATIHIFSRDEKKQWDMQAAYARCANLRFHIGDVRDPERVREVMRGIDIVFNAAALKQVPNCEYAPYEAVKTNIVGAYNVRQAAIEREVETVVSISTDKAVKPVNVMGMSKAIQERLILDPTYRGGTKFVCVRYGNVLGSRGSVVPLFCEHILNNRPLPITNPDMTRFQLTLRQAVQLVLRATLEGESGDLWVRKMPAARVADLGRVLAYGLTGESDYPQQIVGSRPGEKMHEVLVSEEEMWRAQELEEYYLIRSWAKPVDPAVPREGRVAEYASNCTHLLEDEELLEMLTADGWLHDIGCPGPKTRETVNTYGEHDSRESESAVRRIRLRAA